MAVLVFESDSMITWAYAYLRLLYSPYSDSFLLQNQLDKIRRKALLGPGPSQNVTESSRSAQQNNFNHPTSMAGDDNFGVAARGSKFRMTDNTMANEDRLRGGGAAMMDVVNDMDTNKVSLL